MSKQSQQRKRENKRGQETVKYGPQHWISRQTEDVLNETVRPITGKRIGDLIRKIPGVR